MRVLITGGYGFIGSHVAEKFYKEGYEVFIIDDLSTGKKENISFKHNHYMLSIEDPKCEEVLKAYHFDVVVHLAAQVSVAKSLVDPRRDTEVNLAGLVNILSLAQKYGAGKFIFASSAAVYGMNEQLPLTEEAACSPISPYGISKWLGEAYCNKWKEIYDLDCIMFRFSNVYGPRQSNEGEGGVVSIFLDRIVQDQPIHIYGDGNQTRDFIYVVDVADAIFRASNTRLIGVYNLSTNTECSVNNLVEIVKEMHGDVEVLYDSPKEGDIYKSVLNNEKVIHGLDWCPMYDMKKGLEQTYHWIKDKRKKEDSTEEVDISQTTPGQF